MSRSGLGRSLKYFFWQAQLYAALILGGSLVMAAYQRIVANASMSLSDIIHSVPGAVIMLTYVVLFTTGQSAGQYWYSMLISFGCRRIHVFLGHLAMNLLVISESLLVSGLLSYVLHSDSINIFGFPLIFAASLVLEGASKLLGIAIMKWGRIAYVIMIFSIVILCIAFGMFSAFAEESTGPVFTINSLLNPAQQQLLTAVSILFCTAANMISYRMVKYYEVKA